MTEPRWVDASALLAAVERRRWEESQRAPSSPLPPTSPPARRAARPPGAARVSPLLGTRSPGTVERGRRVLALLVEAGPLTRVQVAARLGVKPRDAYYSLCRLRDEGRVASGGAPGGGCLWRPVEDAT